MKLSDEEKLEMLEDATSQERKFAFRKGKQISCRRMSFEEYLDWLQDIMSLTPLAKSDGRERKFFEYKNIKI